MAGSIQDPRQIFGCCPSLWPSWLRCERAKQFTQFHSLRRGALKLDALRCADYYSIESDDPLVKNDGLLSIANDDTILCCHDVKSAEAIAHLSWLLGKNIHIVTPIVLYEKISVDQTYGWRNRSDSSISSYSVSNKYIKWRNFTQLSQFGLNLTPAATAMLHYEFDDGDDEDDGYVMNSYGFAKVNSIITTSKQWVTTSAIDTIHKIHSIDIPILSINEPGIVQKVKNDYPEAALAFGDLISNTFKELRNANLVSNKQEAISIIMEDHVRPNIERIIKERKQILKYRSIRSIAISASLAMPLYFSSQWSSIQSIILGFISAGLGSQIAADLFDVLEKLTDQHKDPYFAAYTMKLHK